MDHILDAPQDERIDERNVTFAGFGPRFAALIADGIIISVAGWVLEQIILDGAVGVMITSIFNILILGYYPYMENTFGATYGKQWLSLLVVNKDLGPISFGQAIIRHIIPIATGVGASLITAYAYFNPANDFAASFDNLGQLAGGLGMYAFVVLLLYFVDFLFFLNSPKHQALHDSFAGTYVIKTNSYGAGRLSKSYRNR
jgi:uncharacterized RDD family membrane protein YckC